MGHCTDEQKTDVCGFPLSSPLFLILNKIRTHSRQQHNKRATDLSEKIFFDIFLNWKRFSSHSYTVYIQAVFKWRLEFGNRDASLTRFNLSLTTRYGTGNARTLSRLDVIKSHHAPRSQKPRPKSRGILSHWTCSNIQKNGNQNLLVLAQLYNLIQNFMYLLSQTAIDGPRATKEQSRRKFKDRPTGTNQKPGDISLSNYIQLTRPNMNYQGEIGSVTLYNPPGRHEEEEKAAKGKVDFLFLFRRRKIRYVMQ